MRLSQYDIDAKLQHRKKFVFPASAARKNYDNFPILNFWRSIFGPRQMPIRRRFEFEIINKIKP